MMVNNDLSESIIFPKGNKVEGPLASVFTGDAWVEMLVTDEKFNCPVYNVTFEPRGRNNWHSHPGGQILLVTGGRGWYQEDGKPGRELKPGDVVKIPSNVKHWHGAAKDSWFTHLGITTNPEKGDAKWFETVTDEEYNKLDS
ncbi:cupin domain-containing protein [Candidatus Woesearchaeota archaeon]|nr:MAG: cupin domain-containing protein [Candidatus Woesearchaeota archaeon]